MSHPWMPGERPCPNFKAEAVGQKIPISISPQLRALIKKQDAAAPEEERCIVRDVEVMNGSPVTKETSVVIAGSSFDRKAYQKAYMKGYMKKYRARKKDKG